MLCQPMPQGEKGSQGLIPSRSRFFSCRYKYPTKGSHFYPGLGPGRYQAKEPSGLLSHGINSLSSTQRGFNINSGGKIPSTIVAKKQPMTVSPSVSR